MTKSETTEHHIADLVWFDVFWPDFDTWLEPEAEDLGNQTYTSYKHLASLWASNMAPDVIDMHDIRVYQGRVYCGRV